MVVVGSFLGQKREYHLDDVLVEHGHIPFLEKPDDVVATHSLKCPVGIEIMSSMAQLIVMAMPRER